MPNLRGSEWLIIILLVVLLFGAKRLPDAARSVGRSLRIFKAETKGLVDGESQPGESAPAQLPGSAPAAPTTPPVTAPEQQAPQAQAPQPQGQPPQQA